MKKKTIFNLLLVLAACAGSPVPEDELSISGQGSQDLDIEASEPVHKSIVSRHNLEDPNLGCPEECACEDAPLKAASFVLTWMTSWGEDDLPQLHPNDVMESGDFVVSSTATDAELDVEVRGLHATCALMLETNLTQMISELPSRTMVLNLLQAATSKMTFIESGQLAPLRELKALHIQGYARKEAVQISGYFSNRVLDMVEHKEESKKLRDEDQDLQLALSEDALTSLVNLQLLDLQYVRLVAALEGGRLRRQIHPVSSKTLLDLPIQEFLSLTDQIRDLDLPPEIMSKMPTLPPASELQSEIEMILLEEREKEEDVVPYDVFKSESDAILAPFISQPQLKYLRVAHAKLDRVGQELLTGLNKLHTLTLEHNHIKILPPAMFSPTPKLRHLSLAHNNILEIEGNTFTGLDKLLTLDLDHNKLDRLGPSSFPSLPSLATLRLLNNPLTHVFPFTFSNVNNTERLLLGSRDVSVELHVDTFRQLSLLKVLQIENTTFISLSRALLEGMPYLKELTIHGRITSIDFDAFTATSNLEHLDLSHCHLNWLSLDAFFGLKKLRYLDLSSNSIDELAPGTFDHLSSLRELYLHHNNLTTLPLGIFVLVPAKLIQLHQNPWHCTCDLFQLKPTITNKVRQPAYTTCRWEETQGTVCTNEDPVRLKYDSRVAPLCASPPQHSYFDVFHVTTRRLKCPKHLFDPTPDPSPRRNVVKEAVKGDEPEAIIVSEEEPNWLPLTAFSAFPAEVKDLLKMAEAEMPEETYAPLTDEDYEDMEREREHLKEVQLKLEDTEEMQLERLNARRTFEVQVRSDEVDEEDEEEEEEVEVESLSVVSLTNGAEMPQGDEAKAYLRSFAKTTMNRQMRNYQKLKADEKMRMEAEHQQAMKDKQLKKEMYLKRLAEEKQRVKQQLETERKLMRERKAQQLQEFLRKQTD
ncbi:uncharacterized protein [Palaemon carinicauda]|uniref:uncharacterized protein n=1 Tax=Palaemon carinicauda TaxID=392227 RepID=UPI0035B64990